MKKILAVIGALVVVVIVALLVIPSLIDWNSYKSEVTTAVNEATGRNLELRGDLSLSLLPFPALSVEDAVLGNVDGATDKNMVTVKEVEVSVALMPLLTGNIRVTQVRLIDPVVSIETFADGTSNLVFDPKNAEGHGPEAGTINSPKDQNAPTGGDAGSDTAPAKNTGESSLASSVRVDSLSIENATIIYRAPGTEEKIEGLTLSVEADSLNGPATGEGYVFYRGIPMTFKLNLGEISQNKPFPVSVRLGIDEVDGGIDVGGQVDLSGDAPDFNGEINGKFDDLRKAAQRIAGDDADIPDIAAKEFDLSGKLAANAKAVTVNDLAVRFGETRGSGALSVATDPKMKADLALRFNQLDLDAIIALANASGGHKDASADSASTPEKAAADVPDATKPNGQSIPAQGRKNGVADAGTAPLIPADLTGSIDLEVESLIYNQTPIHNARINAGIANSKITLNEVSAGLPGGTDLQVFGSISGAKPQVSADLRYEIASENIRAVMRWLGVDVDGVRADRLRRFSLTGGLKGTPDQININNVDMRLDDTAVRGAIVANLDSEGLPALGIGLKLDKINLDQYMGASSAAKPATGDAAANGTTASPDEAASEGAQKGAKQDLVKTIHDALAPLNGLAANYRIGADEVISSGVAIRGIALEGSLNGPDITLKNLSVADAAGMSLQGSGGFLGQKDVPEFKNLKLGVTAKNLEPFVKLTGITLPAPAANYKSMKVDVALNGAITGPNLDASLSNSTMQVALKGQLQDLLGDAPGLKGNITAQAGSLNRALPLVAPTYEPSGDLGRLALQGTVDGNAKNVAVNIAKLAIGAFETSGTVKMDATGERTKLDVSLKGGTLKVDPFLPASKRAALDVPRTGMRRAALPAFDNELLTRVDARDGTPWDDNVIDVSALRLIDGTIAIALNQLDYDHFSLVNPDLSVKMDQGLVTIDKLTGKLGDGPLDVSGTFDARKDTPKLDLTGTLDNANVARVFPIRVANDDVTGTAGAKFTVTATGNTSRALVKALNGTANFMLKDIRFSNAGKRSTDPKLDLRALLRQGPAAMVVEGVGNNDLLRTLDADLQITNGIAKTTRVDATSRVGTADANATLDLPKWIMDTEADFDFSEKINDLPPFSVYAKGKIDDPAISGRMDKVAVKTLENLLGKALGNKKSDSGESQSDGDKAKDAAKGVLKGLLNQFGR
ncbi:AsmA family protein [Thalassospira sp. NFXS8]|uniref:AsmA family protein n=1 Tax=Thalassospira sp. NFXS8 TaxID=2819093 RepID=UPI0032DE8D9E